jgi:hypothetical protein
LSVREADDISEPCDLSVEESELAGIDEASESCDIEFAIGEADIDSKTGSPELF